MTIVVITPRRRIDPLAGHTYRVPIVRELPSPPPEAPGDQTW